MKIASRIIFIIAIALMAYGYWGAFTAAGNKVYDEMAGFFPFFLLVGGSVLFLVFLALVLIMRRRAKK